jgi:nucleotide-binding universal stress UspA family protein
MRILLATDGSPDAHRATELVAGSAWPAGTEVRVIAVAEDLPSWLGASLEPVMPMDTVGFDRRVSADASAAMDEAAARLRAAGLPTDAVVRQGRPSTRIAEEAGDWKADLIVIGSRGRGPFRSMILGSVSAEVVDAAPCPVLVARGETLGPVVLAEDGSDGARQAGDLLIAWPVLAGTGVTVVSVAAAPPLTTFGLAPMAPEVVDIWSGTTEAVQAACHDLAAATAGRLGAAGLKSDAATPEGDPAHALVEEARRRSASLIVMGSRGRTGLARIVLGSVARNVLYHAEQSVLIVKASPIGEGASDPAA